MPSGQLVESADSTTAARDVAAEPAVIEVRGLRKAFKVPTHRIDSFKERAVRPFARQEYRTLNALRDVSFDVHRGEFFGIVGRNGSGKSTLLKVLASIYRADAGSIRMAGRLAPFIELGVGFNPELSARENVVLNGVMMGLSRREARAKLEAVLEFAELEDFVDLKLKNYSSGMLVRLAFSVMIQAEADILLIDEVLAVGDAAFRQKCRDVFHEMRDAGRTIVLVTHDMSTVQTYCHRAMLLDSGAIRYIGDPEETGRRYLRSNFANRKITIGDDREVALVPDLLARVSDAWLEGLHGERVETVETGEPIRLRAVLEARRRLPNLRLDLQFNNADGVQVFGLTREAAAGGRTRGLESGDRIEVSAVVENPLLPGRYSVVCWVSALESEEAAAQQSVKLLEFVVFGMSDRRGIVSVPGELDFEIAPGEETRP